MTKIKICGIRRREDIDYVNECNPDYIGFVFATKSKRMVTRAKAEVLRSRLNKEITPAGVFVNEAVEAVAALVNDGIIDIAQLHGDESEEYIGRLRRLMNRGKIIKAVRVSERADILKAVTCSADYLLFDTYVPGEYGGSGKTFDWELLKDVRRLFFLAGGINSGNLERAVASAHPYAIDLSSAVETDGVKDREKILEVVQRLRETADIKKG